MSGNPDKLAVGVDLGGTNIRAGIITPDGDILAREHIPTPQQDGHLALPTTLIDAIAACVRPLLDRDNIIGVGIGSGGQFDPQTGVLHGINTQHPAFVNVSFGEPLRKKLGLPVFIDNDVRAAALAELKIGAGRGYQHVICVGVGTGIGGALIIDSKLVYGVSGLAGHIGQIVDLQTGTTIENIAGGVPLGKRAAEQGIISGEQTTEDLFIKARSGNNDAATFIASAARQLGYALAGLAHVVQPEVILMGGSVGLQPEYLAAVNVGLNNVLMEKWQTIRALPMQLGGDAGQIGGGLRVFDEL